MPLKTAAPALATLILLSSCGGPREDATPATPRGPVQAPASFQVRFETSKGDFTVEVTRDWAPRGADRFYELIQARLYDNCRFFRVVPRFVVQFGINGDPSVSRLWTQMRIPDDPVLQSNRKGTLSYAKSGPATRTTQVFINLADNARLDSMGFAPFGKVASGMEVIEGLYKLYGDAPPAGVGPLQDRIQLEGNAYLERYFPRLDFVKTARIVQ